jgi:hypothetical protein
VIKDMAPGSKPETLSRRLPDLVVYPQHLLGALRRASNQGTQAAVCPRTDWAIRAAVAVGGGPQRRGRPPAPRVQQLDDEMLPVPLQHRPRPCTAQATPNPEPKNPKPEPAKRRPHAPCSSITHPPMPLPSPKNREHHPMQVEKRRCWSCLPPPFSFTTVFLCSSHEERNAHVLNGRPADRQTCRPAHRTPS